MRTAEAQGIYKLRRQTVEPVFGDIKANKGVTEFLTRGIKAVRTEFNLACIARNIKRIWSQLRDKPSDIPQLASVIASLLEKYWEDNCPTALLVFG